jgi:biopolymer transport protein ExbD
MKNLLFVLLLMFVVAAPLSAQQAAQKVENQCGCEDKPLPEVLGVVNGVKISKQDLSSETRSRVEELQRQVVEARQREYCWKMKRRNAA